MALIRSDKNNIAAVILPRTDTPHSVFDAPEFIDSDSVKYYEAESQIVRDLHAALETRGFEVTHASNLFLSVNAERELFEKTFQADLVTETTDAINRKQTVEFFDISKTVSSARQPISIPDDLSALMSNVALARPPYFHAAPRIIPPHIPITPKLYRYLNVPDELAAALEAVHVAREGLTGKGVTVAMPDTGMESHPYYSARGYNIRATQAGPNASNPKVDQEGHGTGIAANLFAIAPDVELIPVKMAFDLSIGEISVRDAVAALSHAIEEKPDILSMSWGYNIDLTPHDWNGLSNYHKLISTTISQAISRGIVVSVAAGNRGNRSFPAGHPEVISVGGVHYDYENDHFEASNYASSYLSNIFDGRGVPDLCGLVGKEVSYWNYPYSPLILLPVPSDSRKDKVAPPVQDAGWSLFSGTSSATLQVCGVAALLLQYAKAESEIALTPHQVKDILMENCIDIIDGVSATKEKAKKGVDRATGHGLVNARKVIDWAKQNLPNYSS